jgi:hypothetical protein
MIIEEVVASSVCALMFGVFLGWFFHSQEEESPVFVLITEPYEIESYDEEEMRRFQSFFWKWYMMTATLLTVALKLSYGKNTIYYFLESRHV